MAKNFESDSETEELGIPNVVLRYQSYEPAPNPVVLNLWGIPHWWGMAELPSGKWSDSRTTASKFNTSHPNVDLLYKSQPFTEEMESWPTKKWGIGERRLRTPDLTCQKLVNLQAAPTSLKMKKLAEMRIIPDVDNW